MSPINPAEGDQLAFDWISSPAKTSPEIDEMAFSFYFIAMLWIWLFSFLSSAQNTCGDLFAAPAAISREIPPPLLAQVEKVSPPIADQARTLEELYLLLAAEEATWLYSKTPLPEEVLQNLAAHFSARYDFPAEARNQTMFYSNALASLAGRAAWEWKKQTVEALTGEKLSGDGLLTAQALMDSFFSVAGMADRRINLERARDFFASRDWERFPWREALEVAEAWHTSTEKQKGFTAFYPWYEKQTALPALSSEVLQRLYMAVMKDPSPVVCCKSSSACLSCPHNRGWLKQDD